MSHIAFSRDTAVIPPRRAPARTLKAVHWITPEGISIARDLLFAVSVVCALSTLRFPVGRIPVFVVCAVLVAALNLPSLLAFRVSSRAFVLPLFFFVSIHLGSAFQFGLRTAATFVLQTTVASMFVWAFVTRYSQVPMTRFLHYAGIGLSGLLVVVIAYNEAHHKFVSWKLLGQAKSVFSLLPMMLVVLKLSRAKWSSNIFPYLLPIFTICILFSGERKAYIAMALVAPVLINWRSPVTYIVPFLAAVALPGIIAIDKSHYVLGQITGLFSIAQGHVKHTISNDQRAFAVKQAWYLFRHHPIWGAGTSGYHTMVLETYHNGLGTHNEWMRVASENGSVGLFFYGATVLYGFFGLFRQRVWDRARSLNDFKIGYALFIACLLYLSFEALDFVVLMAFFTIPMIQYLRLDPTVTMSGNKQTAGFSARFFNSNISPRRNGSTLNKKTVVNVGGVRVT